MAYLRLNVSNICNFSCKYCHVFSLTKNNYPQKTMSYEVMAFALENFVDILNYYNENFLILSIYGGEPLINKNNLFRLIEKYGNTYKGVKINWMVNTNGSLLDEETADFFKKYNIDIHLSVDGFAETHNKNRVDKFGKGTFEKVENALNLIKQKANRAQLNSFVFPESFNNLLEIVELAKKFKISRISLDLFYNQNDGIPYPKTFPTKYFEVYKYSIENGIYLFGPWSTAFEDYTNISHTNHNTISAEIRSDNKISFIGLDPNMEGLDLELLNYKDFTKNYNKHLQYFNELVNKNCQYCFLRKSCNGKIINHFQYHTRLNNGWKSYCEASKELIKIIKNNLK